MFANAGAEENAEGEIEQPGDMVIYVAGYPAIYGKQPLYFKDPIFQARAAIAAPQFSDKTITKDEAKGIEIWIPGRGRGRLWMEEEGS